MLTAKNCTAAGATKYFTNYYDRGQTRWFGKAAAKLGLVGEIEKEAFENICYGKSPDGSVYLGSKGDPDKRRAGTDFTFSAPKSVSLCALVGGDDRLENAHQIAVEKTLKLIEERYVSTRITRERNVSQIKTGNLAVAEFDHIESRELDPHLHTHALIMNMTQADNEKWYANDLDEIFRNKKHLGTIYQSYLAAEVRELGYEIEHRPHGMFEIKGYERENLVEFSKRRQQILGECPGNSTWQTREDSWHRTRKHKEQISPQELKAKWQEEAKALGIAIVRPGVQTVKPPTQEQPTAKYLNDAIAHCSERSVDFRVQDIEKFILHQRLEIDIAEIKPLCDAHPHLIKLDNSYTTFSALRREDTTIGLMKAGQQQFEPISNAETITDALHNITLNTGQRQAIRLAATTKDRIIAWQGVAGSGKTYALAELKKITDLKGYEIQGFAPSAEAAKVLGDELGVETQTVARKLYSGAEPSSSKQLWVVDEAGLLSSDDALALLHRAERENAKVLLVGDTRQLSAVAAGNPFKSLQAAGMATARLTESQRQKDPNLKVAVDFLADGLTDRGFQQLQQNGSIVAIPKDEFAIQIASEYLALSPPQRAKTLIISSTNDRRREITAAIRDGLHREGSIGPDKFARQLIDYKYTQVEDRYITNYCDGDIIVPIRNYKLLKKGQQYRVEGKHQDTVVLRSPAGEQIETDLNFDKAHYQEQILKVAIGDKLKWTKNDQTQERRNGQQFTIASMTEHLVTISYASGRKEDIDLRELQHIDSALNITTYGSQGKTQERVLVAADGVMNSESFYVAASRAKQELKIYTDSPERLLAMAMESSSNANPRELIGAFNQRQAVFADRSRPIAERQQQTNASTSFRSSFNPSVGELRRTYQYYVEANDLEKAAEIRQIGEKLVSIYLFDGKAPDSFSSDEVSIESCRVPEHLRDENYHQQREPGRNSGWSK
jgi:conjugative relaxase-like TrwC/TraI family protein